MPQPKAKPISAKMQELHQAFEQTFDVELDSTSWGFFAYDDGPPYAGGGVGNFSWFKNRDELIDFIDRFPLLFHSADAEEIPEDILNLMKQVRETLQGWRAGKLEQEATLDVLNKHLAGIEQIKWLGRLSELLEGDSAFAVEIRESFGVDSGTINLDQLDDFSSHLREFGH